MTEPMGISTGAFPQCVRLQGVYDSICMHSLTNSILRTHHIIRMSVKHEHIIAFHIKLQYHSVPGTTPPPEAQIDVCKSPEDPDTEI